MRTRSPWHPQKWIPQNRTDAPMRALHNCSSQQLLYNPSLKEKADRRQEMGLYICRTPQSLPGFLDRVPLASVFNPFTQRAV